MHHEPMEIMKETTEAFKPWLEQVFLKVINMKTNGDVHQKCQKKFIGSRSIFN